MSFSIPGLSAVDSSSQSAAQNQKLGSVGASGYRSSIFNNLALGGSKLESSPSDGASVPVWAWVAMIGGLGGLFYLMLRRRQ